MYMYNKNKLMNTDGINEHTTKCQILNHSLNIGKNNNISNHKSRVTLFGIPWGPKRPHSMKK